MRKQTLLLLAFTMAALQNIHAYKTPGSGGTTYTLDALSAISDAHIYKDVDPSSGTTTYIISQSDTISAGDRFLMSDGVTLLFADDVRLVIEGESDFCLTTGSTFGSAPGTSADDAPAGLVISGMSHTVMQHCTFITVGLRCQSEAGMTLSHCRFADNNGAIGTAAFTLAHATAPFTIEDCTFENSLVPAISGAANYFNPLTIRRCTFTGNSRQNHNKPQLNLTAAANIVIDDCTITGDTTLTMVGGIGISNFYALDDTHLTISHCHITGNRYGIGTVGPISTILIDSCTLVDNRYEVNAMNGGSGISLYDPYGKTTAVISRNTIAGNLWGVTVIGCSDVSLGQPDRTDGVSSPGLNVFRDNGWDGVFYDLYNNSTNTIYAQNNTWNVTHQTEAEIENVIFHRADDNSLGEVIFMPAASTDGISPSTFDLRPSTSDLRPQTFDLRGIPSALRRSPSTIISNGRKMFVR